MIQINTFRTRRITSGVYLEPLDRTETSHPSPRQRKKLLKRKHRKRSSSQEKKLSKGSKETNHVAKQQVSLKQEVYNYASDFEDFEDESSNDEGFGSEALASMSDTNNFENMNKSQFTPVLPTMQEEDEENGDSLYDKNEHDINEKSLDIILQPHVSIFFPNHLRINLTIVLKAFSDELSFHITMIYDSVDL